MTGSNNLNLNHSVINIMIIDHSLNKAEALAQALRSAGSIVQLIACEQKQQIARNISVKTIDTILLRLQDSLPDLAYVRGEVRAADKDIPIIVLYDVEKKPDIISLLQSGAEAVCNTETPELTLFALRKELAHRQAREQVRILQTQLQETEARSRKLLEEGTSAIAYIHEGAHVYANSAYSALFGYETSDDLLGVPLMDMIAPQYHDPVKVVLRNTIKTGEAQAPLEIEVVRKNQETFPASIVYEPTFIDGEPCLQMLVHDRSSSSVSTVEQPSKSPPSTLQTRTVFNEHIDNLLATGVIEGAIYYILLHEHRSISQSLGLDAGDTLIRDIAERLTAATTDKDLIARIADAVFAVYIHDADQNNALTIGQQLKIALDENVSRYNKRLISTKASIGVCLVSGYYQNAIDILNHANEACELARQDSENHVALYKLDTSALDQESQDLAVISTIEGAIAAGRIAVRYQPIASFQGDSDNRYQAHLEILDADQQVFPLEQFYEAAERHKLMLKLDRWLIQSSLKAIARRPKDPPTRLFITLSGNSIEDNKFLHWLETSLEQAEVPGTALVLEVSEFLAERYFENVKPLRNELQKLQIGFTLTEFASGQQTASLLHNLKPDIVKLNTALLTHQSRARREEASKYLGEMAQIAQQNNAEIIAGNVTTAQQMASIWQFGASMAQGSLVQQFSHKMDFDFTEFSA